MDPADSAAHRAAADTRLQYQGVLKSPGWSECAAARHVSPLLGEVAAAVPRRAPRRAMKDYAPATVPCFVRCCASGRRDAEVAAAGAAGEANTTTVSAFEHHT